MSDIKIVSLKSSTEIQLYLDSKAKRNKKLLEFMISSIERTDESLCYYNLIRQINLDLLKLHDNCSNSNQYYAWSVRNIFEINIILRFISLSKDNLNLWISRRGFDEIEILEGILYLSKQPYDENVLSLKNRIDEINKSMEKQGFKKSKLPNIKELSESVGLKDEYISFYKFYSKLIHPTSWLINNDKEETESSQYKNMLFIQLQVYLEDSYFRVSNKYKFNYSE